MVYIGIWFAIGQFLRFFAKSKLKSPSKNGFLILPRSFPKCSKVQNGNGVFSIISVFTVKMILVLGRALTKFIFKNFTESG